MITRRLSFILILSTIGSIPPATLTAVGSHPEKTGQHIDQGEQQKIDELSLAAYMATVAGLASFFIIPVAGLILVPAGFLMGLIAFFSSKKRYARRRGRGLALAAFIVGGAFTLLFFTSFFVYLFSGF